MIKIFKEDNEKIVTKGAYENFYKPLGYEIKNDTTKVVREEVKPQPDTFTSMKKDEVKEKTLKSDEHKKR